MSRSTAIASKFMGVATLGLLTGSSLTLQATVLPSFFSLPSLLPAQQSFNRLQTTSARQQRLLSVISFVSLVSAWILSPRGRRHPYLLWTSLPVAGILASDIWRDCYDSGDQEPSLDEEAINGETVRSRMEKWATSMRWRSWVSGIGWCLGIVGLWGDCA